MTSKDAIALKIQRAGNDINNTLSKLLADGSVRRTLDAKHGAKAQFAIDQILEWELDLQQFRFPQ